MRAGWSLLLLLLAPLVGCPTTPLDDDDSAPGDDDDATGDDDDYASPCVDPWTEGPRMRDEGLERGLDTVTFHPNDVGQEVEGGHASLVAADLDADGDTDLITYTTMQGLLAWENDGTGHFAERPAIVSHNTQPVIAYAAVDLDGDRLPEIIQSSWGEIGFNQNLGGWEWGPVEWIHTDEENGFLIGSFHFGDLDADGDLDLFVPVQVDWEDDLPMASHRVFLQDEDHVFVPRTTVQSSIEPLDSQATMLADYNRDGLMDIVFPGDQGHSSALFRQDGLDGDGVPQFTDVAAATGWDFDKATMGIDGADLNRDGVLDFVVGDIRPPVLLVSMGLDGWIESGAALGITPDIWEDTDGTVGWTVDFADMNNDARLDVIQSSAPHEGEYELTDLFFINDGDDTFTDLTAEWGVEGQDPHFGMATADFDGDGFLDYVATGMGQYPFLLMNSCSEEAWITLDFAGPPLNSEGWGVVVEVHGAEGVQLQTLSNLRGQSQRPALLHFGLGLHDEPVDVVVTWPDGEVTQVDGLEPFARHRIAHPDS